jgi:hypothetical protein
MRWLAEKKTLHTKNPFSEATDFGIENPSVWQIPMFSQIWVDYVRNVCKQVVYCCLNIL